MGGPSKCSGSTLQLHVTSDNEILQTIFAPVVAVDLRVAEVGHHGLLEAADLPLLLELPGPQPVLGVPDDVLQRQPQHRRVLDLLEVEEERHLSLQSFAWKVMLHLDFQLSQITTSSFLYYLNNICHYIY